MQQMYCVLTGNWHIVPWMYFVCCSKFILCDWANIFCVIEQMYVVWLSKCILCDWANVFCVIEQVYFVWCTKCILCDWANVFCAMQQMYFVLTGNWCIVPRMPLTAVFGRQTQSSGGKRKRRTSRECTRGMRFWSRLCFPQEVIVLKD